MKCPTCGRTVKQGQSICQYCGAMVGGLAAKTSAGKPDEFRPPVFDAKAPPATSDHTPDQHEMADEPVFGQAEEGSSAESATESSLPSSPPRPAPPAWVRLVAPLFFFLVFLATQFWLRDSPSPPDTPEPPNLRQAGFTESLPGEDPLRRPVRLKSDFSLKDNRRVVFISSWRESRGSHQYTVDWRSPDGATHRSSQVIVQPPSADRSFTVLAVLVLEPLFPLGVWRAEISQDGQRLGSFTFRLRE